VLESKRNKRMTKKGEDEQQEDIRSLSKNILTPSRLLNILAMFARYKAERNRFSATYGAP
jgi:type I site-specific restriction-modification system R (restriction) subunit